MRSGWSSTAVAGTLLAVVLGGAGTEARAQYSRRTPIVEAVHAYFFGTQSLVFTTPGQAIESVPK